MVFDEDLLEVYKYGGTSLQSLNHFKRAVKFLNGRVKEGYKVVAVVSAIAGHTDSLITKFNKWAPNGSAREYDAYISSGENESSTLLSAMLTNNNIRAISLNAYQAEIKSSNHHKNAFIKTINGEKLKTVLEEYDVIVIPGFQGISSDRDLTTLGRGGSDTSAVAVATALGLTSCNILTDVDGVYKIHPHYLNRSSEVIPKINYEEITEMASLGAEVIHPRAVQIAAKNNILLHIINSKNPTQSKRTIIGPYKSSNSSKVISATILNASLLTFYDVEKRSGEFANLLHLFLNNNFAVNSVVHNITNEEYGIFDLVISDNDVKGVSETLNSASKEYNFDIATSFSLVSIIGQGIENSLGIAAKLFDACKKTNANIRLSTSTAISQSVLVDRNFSKDLYKEVAQVFQLT